MIRSGDKQELIIAKPESHVVGWRARIMGLSVVAITSFGPVLFATVEATPATKASAPATHGLAPVEPDPVPPNRRGRRSSGRKLTGRRGRKSDPGVIDFPDRFRETHGRSPGGSDLMVAFPGMPKSTAYDYARGVA